MLRLSSCSYEANHRYLRRRADPYRQRDGPDACRDVTTSVPQPVKTRDEGGAEARYIQRLIENLHCHLAAMGVPAHHGVEALLHCDRENVGIVREQQISGARNHQLFGIHQIGAFSAALIVDTGDVQNAVAQRRTRDWLRRMPMPTFAASLVS